MDKQLLIEVDGRWSVLCLCFQRLSRFELICIHNTNALGHTLIIIIGSALGCVFSSLTLDGEEVPSFEMED